MPMSFIINLLILTKDVDNWEDLGFSLNISKMDMEAIKAKKPQDEQAKTAMFVAWIENDDNASWENIIPALIHIERRDLANAVRNQYRKTLYKNI